MGKKRRKKDRGFEWVRDDVDGEAIALVERRNRSEEKRRLKEMETLARQLAELAPGLRRRLPVDETTLSAIEDLVAAQPTPDRRRKLLRLKTLLDQTDEVVLVELRSHVG